MAAVSHSGGASGLGPIGPSFPTRASRQLRHLQDERTGTPPGLSAAYVVFKGRVTGLGSLLRVVKAPTAGPVRCACSSRRPPVALPRYLRRSAALLQSSVPGGPPHRPFDPPRRLPISAPAADAHGQPGACPSFRGQPGACPSFEGRRAPVLRTIAGWAHGDICGPPAQGAGPAAPASASCSADPWTPASDSGLAAETRSPAPGARCRSGIGSAA